MKAISSSSGRGSMSIFSAAQQGVLLHQPLDGTAIDGHTTQVEDRLRQVDRQTRIIELPVVVDDPGQKPRPRQ
jgi:hypothetical protein